MFYADYSMDYGRFLIPNDISGALARILHREAQKENQGEAGPSGAGDN